MDIWASTLGRRTAVLRVLYQNIHKRRRLRLPRRSSNLSKNGILPSSPARSKIRTLIRLRALPPHLTTKVEEVVGEGLVDHHLAALRDRPCPQEGVRFVVVLTAKRTALQEYTLTVCRSTPLASP